ncbi:MAG: class I SAM-dependent methyltransferase [Pseudomonadota bacterium]
MVETFPPGHFYSPVPDLPALDPRAFPGAFARSLRFDDAHVVDFAATVFAHAMEFSHLVNHRHTPFDWDNSQFPPADALAYYGILRHLKPSRIVEIGSGFSSLVAMAAVRANGCGAITCIEPFPREFLKNDDGITLIPHAVQAVPDAVFSSLQAGDVLFIDSSHQAKCQSDVVDIFFRVLDLVPKGVFVHFHDIFLPDDYPYFWLAENGIFFNEQYFLCAYLKGNASFECRLPNAYLVRYLREQYEAMVADIHQADSGHFVNDKHGFIKAGSFWLEKVA